MELLTRGGSKGQFHPSLVIFMTATTGTPSISSKPTLSTKTAAAIGFPPAALV
jgi:hypothetical protein